MYKPKVLVVGAGAVGATAAYEIARLNICNTVDLLDIKEGVPEGKAMDIMQARQFLGFDTIVRGFTNDYESSGGNDIVIITSGVPRKPGMTREELISINVSVIKDVVEKVLEHSTEPIFIIVSNPVDSLTYLVHQMLPNYPKNKIIGMGGTLDSARFGYYLSKEFDYHEYCDGLVVGGHGDVTMVPVVESATKNGQRVCLDDDVMNRVIEATKVGGATLTKLLGTSAWLAPGVAIAVMVNAIVNDLRIYLPCSIYREEYCCCIGTNCMLGSNGVEGYEVNLSYESSNPAIYDALERISIVNAEVDKFLRNDSLSSK